MKIAIRYQSRGGNTKAVAEAIGSIIGVKAESIETPIDEVVDILFIGGGVYMWDIDKPLKAFLSELNENHVKNIAAFSTGGSFSGTDKISKISKGKGIPACKQDLSIKMGVKNNSLLGGKGNVILSDRQIDLIKKFVAEIVANQSH